MSDIAKVPAAVRFLSCEPAHSIIVRDANGQALAYVGNPNWRPTWMEG